MSSLFGGKSLFGASNTQNNAANQPGHTGGLFGSTTTATQPQSAGLLGAGASGQPQTQGSGLFGNSAATKPTLGGGLFGNSTTAQQPQSSGGLFGASTAAQSQPQTTGGAFANPAAAQQPSQQPSQQGNLGLGGLGLASTNHGTSSLFGAPPQPNASTNANNQAPQPTTGHFDALLAKSKKHADGEAPLEDLPSLQLGLGDLRQRLRKLGPRTQDQALHGKAHYMLAASGVDPGAAVKDLSFFGAPGRLDRPQTASGPSEIDVETYLANLQTKTTLSMIADGLERSVRDFDNFLEDNVAMEWEAQRKRIYQHFGIKPRDEFSGAGVAGTPSREASGGFGRSRRTKNQQSTPGARGSERASAFGRSHLQKSVIGTPSKIGPHQSEFSDVEAQPGNATSLHGSIDDRFVREKQGKLAERIRHLNVARLEGRPFPVLFELGEVEGRSGDRHAQQLVDAYHAVMEIVGENPDAETTANNATAKERQFAKMYLDVNPNSQDSINMRKKILEGANSFLEKQFFQEIESLIAKYPREANLGGRPDVVSKIKAYIRLRYARKDLVPDNTELQQVQGEYVWAVVFYLLRSGHVAEAATYVNNNSATFRSIDRTFTSYLLEYASSPERRLKRNLQDRCNNEYSQRTRNAPENSIDPFRMACHKIIGRCEVSNRSLDGLNTDINDWIWLQFNLARENDRVSEVAAESYTLADLQTSIREIGLKHFPKSPSEDTNGTFGMFFFLQILAGMFEQAIAYLYPFSYVDAIHFAIALEFYGLLRASDPWSAPSELLTYTTRSLPQISFGRMLGYYTRDFRAADVSSAVDYLVLVCLNQDLEGDGGRQQAELCHVALRELVLETREFSKLIGDIRPDGQRITGLIEERGPLIGLTEEDEFVKAVTLQAARFADDNGRTTDAVLLYHLAGDYDSVVTIVGRALSEAISLEIGEDPIRLAPIKPRADGQDAEAQSGSSLSLAAIDDPIDLARTMMSMYEKDAMFYTKIDNENRNACHVLLQMSEIKGMVQAGRWAESLDKMKALDILPLDANGDSRKIRHYASKFTGLSQSVSTNVSNLLMWAIVCCIREREHHLNSQYSGNEGTRRMMVDQLKQISLDLTTYTSQLKYRFPPHLHEALARASAD